MTRCVGFDVGGTHVRAVATWTTHGDGGTPSWQQGPAVRATWRGHSDTAAPPVAALGDVLRDLATEAIAAADQTATPGDTWRYGVGVAAQLDRDARRVVNAPNIGWRDVALAEGLEAALGGSVVLVNDVNAILLGEVAFGAARGERDVLAVYVGTGVGGAVVANGALVGGASGTAGEIGHVKIRGYDGLCGCGERGCVEALAGGAALLRRLELDAKARRTAMVDGRAPTATDIDARWQAGDAYSLALWADLADALGHVIAGACTLLNPSLLLLGGGVLDHAPLLGQRIAERSVELTLASSRPALRVARGELGDLAGALGAAASAA